MRLCTPPNMTVRRRTGEGQHPGTDRAAGDSDPKMEEHVPRTPWRRRRTTDSPRPAGRRWAGRLRRSGTIARQALLVRVGRRNTETSRAATATRAEVLYTGPEPGLTHTFPAVPGVSLNTPVTPLSFEEEPVPA